MRDGTLFTGKMGKSKQPVEYSRSWRQDPVCLLVLLHCTWSLLAIFCSNVTYHHTIRVYVSYHLYMATYYPRMPSFLIVLDLCKIMQFQHFSNVQERSLIVYVLYFVELMRQWKTPCTQDSAPRTWSRRQSLHTVHVTLTHQILALMRPSYRTVLQPSKPSEAKRGVIIQSYKYYIYTLFYN